MCRRFVMLEWDEVLQIMQCVEMGVPIGVGEDWPMWHGDAYPGAEVPVIARTADGGLEAQALRWGLEAPWDVKRLLFNTRIETALGQEGGIWQDAIQNGRCIVPTWGFFESSATETTPSPRTGKPMKRQYAFSVPEGPTLLAGVQDREAFSVVTTEPNEWVAPVHDRMPLVLRPDEVHQWIDGDFAALADRGAVRLDAVAEPAPDIPEDRQTRLF